VSESTIRKRTGARRARPRRLLPRALPALLSIPFLLLAGAGILGGYLHSGQFWWAAVAAVVLPASVIALAVVTGLMILMRRWDWATANAALLCLVMLSMLPFERFGAPPPPEEGDLVIMSFSVARHGETVEGLALDLLELLDEQQPDVVVLQKTAAWRQRETPGMALVADYVQPSLDSLGYLLAIPARLADRRTQLPVLTRPNGPTVLAQREGTLADDLLASRYVRTHFRWNGREAVLYNVHLRGYGAEKPWEEARFPLLQPRDWLPFVRRYRKAFRLRAEEVRLLREQLAAEELPVIVAGDLNVTARNWDYRQLARHRTDAFRAAGRGWGATYRGDLPLVRIDYVLLDQAFEVVSAHVPNVRFSDHRPVVATIRWAGEHNSSVRTGVFSDPNGPNPDPSP
jgi:endonuclease/exonuclease/phosphatase family metal-dependent hydrolase